MMQENFASLHGFLWKIISKEIIETPFSENKSRAHIIFSGEAICIFDEYLKQTRTRAKTDLKTKPSVKNVDWKKNYNKQEISNFISNHYGRLALYDRAKENPSDFASETKINDQTKNILKKVKTDSSEKGIIFSEEISDSPKSLDQDIEIKDLVNLPTFQNFKIPKTTWKDFRFKTTSKAINFTLSHLQKDNEKEDLAKLFFFIFLHLIEEIEYTLQTAVKFAQFEFSDFKEHLWLIKMRQREAFFRKTGDMFAISRNYFGTFLVSNTFYLYRSGKKSEYLLCKSEETKGNYKMLDQDLQKNFKKKKDLSDILRGIIHGDPPDNDDIHKNFFAVQIFELLFYVEPSRCLNAFIHNMIYLDLPKIKLISLPMSIKGAVEVVRRLFEQQIENLPNGDRCIIGLFKYDFSKGSVLSYETSLFLLREWSLIKSWLEFEGNLLELQVMISLEQDAFLKKVVERWKTVLKGLEFFKGKKKTQKKQYYKTILRHIENPNLDFHDKLQVVMEDYELKQKQKDQDSLDFIRNKMQETLTRLDEQFTSDKFQLMRNGLATKIKLSLGQTFYPSTHNAESAKIEEEKSDDDYMIKKKETNNLDFLYDKKKISPKKKEKK